MTKTKVLYTVAIVGCLLRFFYLGQDLPSQRLTSHNESDQFFYTFPAMLYNATGEFSTPFPPGKEYIRLQFDVLQNLLTVPVYAIFGEHYWSLKIPGLLVSLVALYLIFSCLKLLNFSDQTIALVMLFASTEFMFFITSRVANPTPFSVMGIALICWMAIKSRSNSKYIFWLGAAGVFSVLFIYVFNLYALGAAGVFVLIAGYTQKQLLKHVLHFFLGGVTMFAFYNLVTFVCFDKTIIDLLSNLQNFSGGNDFRFLEKAQLSLITRVKNTVGAMLTFNTFKFTLLLIPVIMLGVSGNLRKWMVQLDPVPVFLLCAFVFAGAQTFVEPLHSSKKLTSLTPILFIWCAYGIEAFSTIATDRKAKLIQSIGMVLGCFIAMYCYNITTSDWYQSHRWGDPLSGTFLTCSVVSLIGGLCLLFTGTWKFKSWMPLIVVALMVLPSTVLVKEEIVTNRSYNWTNTVNRLQANQYEGHMAGDLCVAFMLHTDLVARHFPAKMDHQVYAHQLDSLLENNLVQSVAFLKDKYAKEGFDFEKTYGINNAKVGDTLITGNNYYILADHILEQGQGLKSYVGKRRSR